MYKRRENTTLEFDPIECFSLFEAEYIGIHVPNSCKWDIQRDFPDSFELLPENQMIIKLTNFKDFNYFKSYKNVYSKLYNTFGLPRFTLIVAIGPKAYFLPPGVNTTSIIRRGYPVLGLAQLMHPDDDIFSEVINVPVRERPLFSDMSTRCFTTIKKNKGFYDPRLPYIDVKMFTNQAVANFITKGLQS